MGKVVFDFVGSLIPNKLRNMGVYILRVWGGSFWGGGSKNESCGKLSETSLFFGMSGVRAFFVDHLP